MNWQVQHINGRYVIRDNEGDVRGQYKSAYDLATHLAFALRELDELRNQIATEQLYAHLEKATALVASWPKWKQNILRNSGLSTVEVPRTPINDG